MTKMQTKKTMETQRVLTVIVEKTSTGFSAYSKEIDGLATIGDNLSELKRNFNEVLYYHVEYLEEKGETISVEDFKINYVLDLEQFFEYFDVLNKSAFAKHYLKMNQSLFRQYTKKLAPLSDERLKEISLGLHQLADDLNGLVLA